MSEVNYRPTSSWAVSVRNLFVVVAFDTSVVLSLALSPTLPLSLAMHVASACFQNPSNDALLHVYKST